MTYKIICCIDCYKEYKLDYRLYGEKCECGGELYICEKMINGGISSTQFLINITKRLEEGVIK